MNRDFFILMKFELLVVVIIFVLLFIKLGSSTWKNKTILRIANVLLLINFIAGFLMNHDGMLFGDMFRTTKLIELQKNILNLGTLIISAQAYSWLKNHKHVLEFYM